MRQVNREYKGPRVRLVAMDLTLVVIITYQPNLAAPASASTPALNKLSPSNANNNKTSKPKKPTKRSSITPTFPKSIETNTQEAVTIKR